MDIYVVTNRTESGEYTPCVCNTLSEAQKWVKELTVTNIRSWIGSRVNAYGWLSPEAYDDDDKLLEYSKEYLGLEYSELGSCLNYSADEYQDVTVYKMTIPLRLSHDEKYAVYNEVKRGLVADDVRTFADDNNLELTDEVIKGVVSQFVDDGDVDANASHWDNIRRLVDKELQHS